MVICDPGLSTIQAIAQYDSLVYPDFQDSLEVSVVPDVFVESAKNTVYLSQSVVCCFGNLGIMRDDTSKITESLYSFQLCLANCDDRKVVHKRCWLMQDYHPL